MTGDEAGSAAAIVKALGVDRASALIPTYLEMTDAWFMKTKHSLKTMRGNLNAIRMKHEAGVELKPVGIAQTRVEENNQALNEFLERRKKT